MSCFNMFPYTNFHELNLEWLIQEVKRNRDRIGTLDARITAVENTIDNFKLEIQDQMDVFRKEFNDLSDDLQNQLDEGLAQAKTYTDTEVGKLRDEIRNSGLTVFWDVFRHTYRPGQTLFDDYYNFLRDKMYTCKWWDAEEEGNGITWEQYDALGKTPLEWDLEGEVIVRTLTNNWPWIDNSGGSN